MIKFSRREDYAVILVNKLAKEYQKRLVPLSEVAREYNISVLFLRNLANDLRVAGIIKAIEGKSGGYYIEKNPKQIKMGDILKVFSKESIFQCCPTGSKSKNKRHCPKEDFCEAGNIWRQLNKEFLEKIYNLSLQEFMEYKSKSN